VRERWRAVNAAVLAWNAYLPLLQQGRPAEALPALLPALQLLLAAPAEPGRAAAAAAGAADRGWQVACRLAEAVAQGAEHVALLQLLRPAAGGAAPASDAGVAATAAAAFAAGGARASSAGAAAGGAQPAGGGAGGLDLAGGEAFPLELAFSQGATPWYAALSKARERAGEGLAVRGFEAVESMGWATGMCTKADPPPKRLQSASEF
jgi:hypothetical protein